MTEIRDAVLSDAERLLEIFGYYIENTAITFDYEVPSAEQFRSKMERIAERYPFLVIERDGRIEGYAYAGPFVGRAAYGWSCETTVYIAPEARGCGLGGMLYGALERKLREMGITNMYACIGYTENEDGYLTKNSADFHEHMGFAKVGEFRRCGYKFGRWYDMIWMEKIIGEHKDRQPEVRSYSEPRGPAAEGDRKRPAGNEKSFWEHVWESADQAKISEYISRLDMSEDPLICFLKERGAVNVCDAGCGCGAYSLKLCRHGFAVSGFDIATEAVAMTKELLSRNGFDSEGFRKADIMSTGFDDGVFDAVVAREILDHLTAKDGAAAVRELLRVTRPGGSLLLTLDDTDPEYESEPHGTSVDGDYLFTGGKWNGMVFHPYSPEDIRTLTGDRCKVTVLPCGSGIAAAIEKEAE